MRRGAISAVCAAAVSLAAAAPAWAGPEAGLTSDNVTHVRNIAKHADSSGARKVGNFFYITTGRNLTIYDVSTPENPTEVGDLVLPKVAEPAFAEEDVDTDGRILLVENGDTLFVIDVTDKTDPEVMSQVDDADTHTITCVLSCTYAYGNNGKIFDLRDPENPVLTMGNWETKFPVESTHDVTEVEPGVILTASQPMLLLDARPSDRGSPTDPALIRSTAPEADRFVHATRWPRAAQDDFLLVGGEEIGPQCSGSASSTFSTWNADTFTQIDEYRVLPGVPTQGRLPDSTFCTHWFQEHPRYENGGLVAISWYEQGTRFLRVGQDGQISEEGYFLPTGAPVAGQASAAYWISDRVVYVADYLRGLDVLRFEGDVGADAPPAPTPTPAPAGGGNGSGNSDGNGTSNGTGARQNPATARRRKLSSYVYLPRMSRCLGSRGLRIGLRRRPPEKVRVLAVYVNGKRAGFFRSRRLRRRVFVKLSRLPSMIVRVAVRTRSGRLVFNTRSYARCGARPATVVPAGTVGSLAKGSTTYGALCYLRARQAAD